MSEDRLTQRQRLAALLLAGGLSVGDTAETAGVDPSTIARWRRHPAFQQAVQAEGDDLLLELRCSFTAMATRAYHVLGQLLDDDNQNTRLRAALQILDRIGLGKLKPIPSANLGAQKLVVEYMTPDGLPYSAQLREEILDERRRELGLTEEQYPDPAVVRAEALYEALCEAGFGAPTPPAGESRATAGQDVAARREEEPGAGSVRLDLGANYGWSDW